MDLIKTGQFITEARKNLGITQKELADRIGVTDKAVSRWETGKGFPDVSVLKALSETLGVSITEIVNGEKSSPENIGEKSDNAILETFSYIGNMTAKAIDAVVLVVGVILIFSPLYLAERQGAPWLLLLGQTGIIVALLTLFFIFRHKRPQKRKHRPLSKIAAEIISLSALAITLILEILPWGISMNFSAGPDKNIVRTFSYFSPIPWGYGNFLPMLTAILTVAVTTLSVISMFKKSGGSPRNVTFICTAVALTFSVLSILIFHAGYIFVPALLLISMFFQGYANRNMP